MKLKKHLIISLILGTVFGFFIVLVNSGETGELPKTVVELISYGLVSGLMIMGGYWLTVTGYNPAWEGLKFIWYGGNVPKE